jgi:hypothetical protein
VRGILHILYSLYSILSVYIYTLCSEPQVFDKITPEHVESIKACEVIEGLYAGVLGEHIDIPETLDDLEALVHDITKRLGLSDASEGWGTMAKEKAKTARRVYDLMVRHLKLCRVLMGLEVDAEQAARYVSRKQAAVSSIKPEDLDDELDQAESELEFALASQAATAKAVKKSAM